MKIKKLNPVTPGTRHQVILSKNLLGKNSSFVKNLITYFHRKKGRGLGLGHITVWHKGAGHKKVYRLINLGNFFSKLIVLANVYDPYRNSYISLVFNIVKKQFDFLLTTEYVNPGALLFFSFEFIFLDLRLGYRTLIKNISAGTFIHCLAKNLFSRIKYIRSAGTVGQIIQKTTLYFKVRLPSGQVIELSNLSVATIGKTSNSAYKLIRLGKAGRRRLMGVRPTVRGVAMNPVDHPHGGRTNGGRPCVTPWAIPTKGKPTSKKKF